MFVGDVYSKMWMVNHENTIKFRFLKRYHPIEKDDIFKRMYENSPALSMLGVKDCMIPDIQKIATIRKKISESAGEIWIIAGKKGSGKTATGYWLLEQAHAMGRKCCVAGPRQYVPKWVKRVPHPAAAPDDSVVFVVEAGMQFAARTSMYGDQRDALSILPVLRHSGRLIIAETQHTRIIDVNFLRMLDMMVLKQEPFFKKSERHPIMNILDILKPKKVWETLFFKDDWFTLLQHQDKPKCWSKKLELSYAPIRTEKEAKAQAIEMLEEGASLVAVKNYMMGRSFKRPLWQWQEWFGESSQEPPPRDSSPPIEDEPRDSSLPLGESLAPPVEREPSPSPPRGGKRKTHYADEYK